MYTNWSYFIQRLLWFKEQYGHCNVPNIFPANQPLSGWTKLIRTKKMLGQLTNEQFTELNKIGFVWSSNNRKWEQNLFDLMEFHKTNGDFDVIGRKNDKLRIWLYNTRKQYQNNTLTDERIKALKMIGFPIEKWNNSR
jgi:hypothetical protein